MTTTALKNRVHKKIDKLSSDKIKVVENFIDEIDEMNEATKELLAIPGFEERMKKAEKEIAEGKVYDYDKIKRNV